MDRTPSDAAKCSQLARESSSPDGRLLKAEDGTEFFGRVEPFGGLFRASCYANTADQTVQREFKMHRSEDEALRWIELRARQRGFSNWSLAPPSAQDDKRARHTVKYSAKAPAPRISPGFKLGRLPPDR